MTFKDYLISKKTILIIFFSFQFLALFLNVFGIEGRFHTKSDCSDNKVTNYFFTDNKYSDDEDKYQSNFWPFVKFFYHSGEEGDWCADPYMGLFRYYDYSEFLGYTAILFLTLYIFWSSNKVKPKKNG